MMAILIFITTGLVLLGVVIRFLSRTRFQSDDDFNLNTAASLLSADNVLWTRQMGERIFSQLDLDFVMKDAPLLRRRLVRERRSVALCWIAQRKAAATAIMRYHQLAARSNADLSPGLEIKLAANYLGLLAACRLAQFVVLLRGPFTSGKMASGIIAVGERMTSMSYALLGTLDAGSLDEMRNGPAGTIRR